MALSGRVAYWPKCELPTGFGMVRSQGRTGRHLLAVNSSQFDAVDGAHSAASKCHGVVALEQATLRGAVHGRG